MLIHYINLPYRMAERAPRSVSVYLDPPEYHAVKRIAKDEERSVTKVLERWIRERLAQERARPPNGGS